MYSKTKHLNEWSHRLPRFTDDQIRALFFMMEDYAREYHEKELLKIK